jgi:hypothetical protein
VARARFVKVGMVAVAATGMLFAGLGGGGASAAVRAANQVGSRASVPTVHPGFVGSAQKVARVQAATSSSATLLSTRAHGVRRTTAAQGATAPSAVSGLGTTASHIVANFDGTSSKDSQFTNYNATFEPPDQGLCAGAGFVLEPVNSAYRIFRTNGTTVRGPFNVNDLFNEGGKEFTSDPRCWYDAPTHTWFAIILFISSTNDEGRIDIAVNPTSDPTGQWTEYQVDTTDDGRLGEPSNPGCPCFGDQPRLGVDQTNLYVTTDEFSILGPQFNGGQVYALPKSELIAGVPSPHVVHFPNLHIAGQLSGAPQPALSTGTPPAEFFLSQLDFAGSGDHRLGVWAMTQRDAVAHGGVPRLTSTVIGSEAYSIPPPSPQKGAISTIDSGDDRMQQVEFMNGSVWGELGTALRPAGDSSTRAGAAWFQVRPQLGAHGIAGASIQRQGYVSQTGENVLYPAVQPDAAGNAAMVFSITGTDRFPSAAYAALKVGAAAFGAPVVVAAGSGPYDPNATRWGDYSFAVPSLSGDEAWLSTEYMPPRRSQTTTGAKNWGTRVFEVALS